MPDDLAKLSNLVKIDVVKKTEYFSLKTKIDNIDTSNFVSRNKYEKDGSDFEDKLTKIENEIPDITNLATKSSITSLLPTSTVNSKITEIENKITSVDNKIPSISGLATKTELTNVENEIPDSNGFVKKSDYATEITSVKNHYVTNTALDSRINSLKKNRIADEVKKVDDKTEKNASDILGFESRLKQKEDIVYEGQRENSFTMEFYYYLQQSYLIYESKDYSFKKDSNNKLTAWKSTGIDNLSVNSDLKAISDATLLLPNLKNNGILSVKFDGNYFVQNKVLHSNSNNVVNIYVVYELNPISFSRNTDFTIQNADTSKNKYEEYGIFFDEVGTFTSGNITNGRNVLIFDADMSFSSHFTNKANNIYVLGKDFVRINDTTLYAEKIYKTNFTGPNKKIVLSLHYNFSNSYLFVNGTQELKFKSKADQILKKKKSV